MNAKAKRIWSNILASILVISIMIASFFTLINIVFNIVYAKSDVRGTSMQPVLNVGISDINTPGDTVYINRFSDYGLNDLVVASVDWWDLGTIIKRLVAMPGDQLKIINNGDSYTLFVNNIELYTKEKNGTSEYDSALSSYYNQYRAYIAERRGTPSVGVDVSGDEVIIMQNDEYFLLGDNWVESEDSMIHGPVSSEHLHGRVEMVVRRDESNKLMCLIKQMINIIFYNGRENVSF